MTHNIHGSNTAQIAASIESAIRSERLGAGALLPTVRELATSLAVSPTTVNAAYRALRQRGLLVAEGRRGTRVRALPSLRTPIGSRVPPGARDLATGNPDPNLLPPLADALRRIDPSPHLYAEEHVHPALLELARRDFEADKIPAQHLVVVSGALDGIDRALQAHLRAGDRIAVEDPGFANLFDLIDALHCDTVPMAVDDEGPLPESLEAALVAGARAVVVTPRAQNPFGSALGASRTRKLRAILKGQPDLLLLEDDHSNLVSGAPARTLVQRDTPRWAVVRSVSKALGPDLRVAWMSGDRETIGRIDDRQRVGFRWVSHLLQQLVVELWRNPEVQKGASAASEAYRERREALIRALAARGIDARGASGMNVWIPVREEAPVLQSLLAAGFAAAGGERFRLDTPAAVRVTISSLEPADVAAVADAIESGVRGSRVASAAV